MNTTTDITVEDHILQLLQHLGIRKAHFVAGGEVSDEDTRRHAQEWIEANRSQVNGWLDTAQSAAK